MMNINRTAGSFEARRLAVAFGIAAGEVIFFSENARELIEKTPSRLSHAVLGQCVSIRVGEDQAARDEMPEGGLNGLAVDAQKAIELIGRDPVADVLTAHPVHHLQDLVLTLHAVQIATLTTASSTITGKTSRCKLLSFAQAPVRRSKLRPWLGQARAR